jgi:hypothetical protein
MAQCGRSRSLLRRVRVRAVSAPTDRAVLILGILLSPCGIALEALEPLL